VALFLSIGGFLETVCIVELVVIEVAKGCDSEEGPDLEPSSLRLELELLLVLLFARFIESIFLMPTRLGVLGESNESNEFLFEALLLLTKSHFLFD